MSLCEGRAIRRVAMNELGLSKIVFIEKPNNIFNNVEHLFKIMVIPHSYRKENQKCFNVAYNVHQHCISTHVFRFIFHNIFICNLLAKHRSHLTLDYGGIRPSTT